jgi:hypothetical protein
MSAPDGSVAFGSQKITSYGTATADTDVPSWGQVKDLISGLRKSDVRVVATSNLTLSGTQTIDGIAVIAGDRVLATGQTTQSANGIYTVAAGAWSRATDADVAGEFATHWLVTVTEGTVNGNTLWSHTTDGAVTLGTTSLTFAKIGPVASGGTNGAAANCPSTSAGGSWAYAHGLGSRDVVVQFYRNSSPWDEVDVAFERTDANTVTFKPDAALALNEYRAVVWKVL